MPPKRLFPYDLVGVCRGRSDSGARPYFRCIILGAASWWAYTCDRKDGEAGGLAKLPRSGFCSSGSQKASPPTGVCSNIYSLSFGPIRPFGPLMQRPNNSLSANRCRGVNAWFAGCGACNSCHPRLWATATIEHHGHSDNNNVLCPKHLSHCDNTAASADTPRGPPRAPWPVY